MHFSWLALIFSDHIAFLYFWCNFPMKSYTSHWRYIRWSNKIGKHWQWRHRRQKLMESWCDYPHREENMSPNSWKLACFTNQKHFAHFSKQSNVMELWLEFSITKIKLKIYASVPDIERWNECHWSFRWTISKWRIWKQIGGELNTVLGIFDKTFVLQNVQNIQKLCLVTHFFSSIKINKSINTQNLPFYPIVCSRIN